MNAPTTYNGWSNKQTWVIYSRFEETFYRMAEEKKHGIVFNSVKHMAEAFENVVFEIELDNLKASDFVREIVDEYLNEVDFEEIAKHYYEESEEEESAELV